MLTYWTDGYLLGGETGPQGLVLVLDLRLRWACEEASFEYEAKTTPFDDRSPDQFAKQPFGQVPFIALLPILH